MSEDGFSDGFDEPNMEIQIDTLLGTSFDMRVSSTDTVREIKQRIQRVEGIPIHQQNLIFQSKELKDSRRLCDVGIKNGSTIRLVLAMKGGPISTRRLSVSCEHHMMLKELKELLENTRDEIGEKLAPGSKVSVLVFKEGDIVNLLRVIENEDGSYSPYSEKPISPPSKPHRRGGDAGSISGGGGFGGGAAAISEKSLENTDLTTKIANLRKKMGDVSLRRQLRHHHANHNGLLRRGGGDKDVEEFEFDEERLFGEAAAASRSGDDKGNLSYKLLTECANDLLDNIDLKIFEKEEGNHSETEEVALKDKHRIKSTRKSSLVSSSGSSLSKSLYSETKGAHSHTKQNYARIHKKARELRTAGGGVLGDIISRKPTKMITTTTIADHGSKKCCGSPPPVGGLLHFDEEEGGDGDNRRHTRRRRRADAVATDIVDGVETPELCLPVSAATPLTKRGTVHLTRLVLSSADVGVERPKSTPTADSIELEETAQDALSWEIHEPSAERLKHSSSATACKLGVLKRRQSLDYGYEGLEGNNVKQEIGGGGGGVGGEYNYACKNSDFEVCSSGNFFHMPQYIPSGLPPHLAPKEELELLLSNDTRTSSTPLYRRKTTDDDVIVSGEQQSEVVKTEAGGVSGGSGGSTSGGSGVGVGGTGRYNFLSECSSIQRLKNDCASAAAAPSPSLPPVVTTSSSSSLTDKNLLGESLYDESIDELYGYYNLGCATELLGDNNNKATMSTSDGLGNQRSRRNNDDDLDDGADLFPTSRLKKDIELPPVIKKKSRCSECNKRLNITNIYNCRCGKIFCSQHRYSEVHRCSYDYKTEGRRLLEHQNPLVTANKISRI